MAEGLNRVILIGNLGADPELRVTPGGQAVLNMRLATTESYLDRNNTRQEKTEWHSIAVWGRRGEALSKILGKGDRVGVEGSIRTSSYEKDGEKRYRTEINASNVYLCGGGRGGSRDDSDRRDDRGNGGRSQQQQVPGTEGRGTSRKADSGSGNGGGSSKSSTPPDHDYNDYGYGGDDDIPFVTDATFGRWDRP